MSFLAASVLILVLALSLVPVWLVRNQKGAEPQDFFIGPEKVSPAALANSAVASAVRAVLLVAAFAFGSMGEFRPVAVAALAFALGVWVFGLVGGAAAAFTRQARAEGRSATPHILAAEASITGFGARAASVLSLVGIAALFALDAKVTFDALEPLGPSLTGALALASVAVVLVGACRAGGSGALRSTQLQLGLLYFGLFGAAAHLLYLSMAGGRPTATGAVGIAGAVLLAFAMILYRRSKYVDPTALQRAEAPAESLPPGERRVARALSTFARLFNRAITALLVTVVVFGGMQLYFSGALFDGSIPRSLSGGTRYGPLILIWIAIGCFLYPLGDMANWQRIAAFARSPEANSAAIRRAIAIYALETPLAVLFMCMLGAIASPAVEDPAGAALGSTIEFLARQDNAISAGAVWFLALAVLTAAVASGIALLSAAFWIVRMDLLREPRDERSARRLAMLAGAAWCALAVAIAFAADIALPAPRVLQLAMLPVLLSPLLGFALLRRR